MHLKRLSPVAVLALAALASACGSTVPGGLRTANGSALGGPSADGLGSTDGPTAGPLAVAGTGVGTPGPSTTAAGTPTGVVPVGGTTVPEATAQAEVPGVTAKAVYIGIIHDANADAVNQAAGVGSISHGDDTANYRAVIDDINKNGGVGGRKLVAVVAPFNTASTQTLDQQYSAVCQHFTQDNPRVFVADVAGGRSSYRKCLRDGGAGLLDDGLPTDGAAEFARFPAFLEQGFPNVDRLAAYYVTPLVAQHYFTPWNTVTGAPAATGTVKVGILTFDDTVFSHAVDHILVPALKRLGYTPLVEKISQIGGATDLGAQAAAVKSAQLAFAANRVTHVIPFESNGGLSTFFLPTARSQRYYPRYGVSTGSGSEALVESGAIDKAQMKGAVGFGWVPSVDLRAADNLPTGPYSNGNRRHCLKVMRDHGITFTSGNAEGIALGVCADLYLLKAALDTIPTHITLDSFVRTVESLGTSYQPAGGVGEDFRPGRQDGSDKAYFWSYVDACTCFRYHGAPQTVP